MINSNSSEQEFFSIADSDQFLTHTSNFELEKSFPDSHKYYFKFIRIRCKDNDSKTLVSYFS